MAAFNRSRYEITVGDGWQRFSSRLPACEMLGVIRVGDVEGALVRYVSDASYVLVSGSFVMTLLTRKVEAAIDARRAA